MTRPLSTIFVLPGLLPKAALAACVGAAALLTAAPAALAQRAVAAQPGGNVTLPYTVPGSDGNQWRIYQYGHLQQSGNQPQYSQGAMLMVNGNQPMLQNRMARLDDKTGELILENMQSNNLSITRRLAFDKEVNLVRYLDIIKNTSGQEQNAQIVIQSSLNFGVNSSITVPDPKKAAQQLGWVATTGSGGTVMEMFNGKGAKNALTINYQQGNNVVMANYTATLKPGQEIALLHLHATMGSTDAASTYMTKLKEIDLIKKIPQPLRKLIVNWAVGSNFVGEIELLRGDLLDVVELKGGDQLKGTLKEDSYELSTFHGPVSLPVDKVIALMNVGAFRPHQLVVTSDGQIFGGTLKQETLSMQLSSGQVTKIPMAQVTRMGYRKRQGEPEEWTFEKPMVVMQSGERMNVKMPTAPFEVATRYGRMTIKPEQLASVILRSDEPGVHQFTLVDGSKFTGLLAADVLEMTLEIGAGDTQAKFPVSSIAKFQLNAKPAEVDDLSPTIRLADEDALIGTLTGELKIDTAFDTLTIDAAEARELNHPAAGADVQVVLFDGTTVSGRLQQMELSAQLAGGLKLKLPLALLQSYQQPQPSPGKETQQKITELVKELSNADWKARDRAQQGLVAIGPAATGSLRRAREGAEGDVQARIDAILKELEKQRVKPAAKAPAKPGNAGNAMEQNVQRLDGVRQQLEIDQ